MNKSSLFPPKPEISLSLALPSQSPSAAAQAGLRAEERGIRLIHLLLTCAKHASSGNIHLADDCLRQISELASVTGDSIQRLATRFASALAVRLVKRWHGLYKALTHNHLPAPPRGLDRGRALFARAVPFLGVAYSIVTQTLIQAMMDERSVHVVDLGSDPNLGPAILRAFSQAPTGPPSHLKISCVNKSKVQLDDLGSSLAKEASSLDLPFQFNPVAMALKDLTIDKLDLKSNEALGFVSILSLHGLLAEDDRVDAHFGGSDDNSSGIKNCKPMTEFLSMLNLMSPKFVLLVEQEVDHNHVRLVDRFVEGLHYYSAVFDSVDATSGIGNEERLVLEEMLGREIENIVACEGVEREERHERYHRWVVRFTGAGFKPARIWYDPTEQIGQMTSRGTNGYKIVSERCSLMICWHDRPLFAVSLWTC